MSVLRRNEADRFSTVTREWAGEMVVLIGGGPSLSFEQVEAVNRAHSDGDVCVIGCNDAYLLAPWCDILYFADAQWFDWHTKGVDRRCIGLSAAAVAERFASFSGLKCTIQSNQERIPPGDVHMLRNKGFPVHTLGLSLDPGALVTGRNSGFQALNLAVLAGAETVLLIGFDGREPRNNEKSHWFGDHPIPDAWDVHQHYRRAFSAAEHLLEAAGCRVINCSPGSAIDSFERSSIDDALRLQPVEA